ncbi:piggyBac transposable element-derived protein 4-like [Vespula maculifrons]|uniref:PiggyBac transposable element-derived protein 4-like n=1 Tax=Vespula maculifrons TaxID=7453 RepID=A0ABD2BIJ5_VESMC
MFTDRYYTNFILAQELSQLKCYLTGTILTKRKKLPNEIKRSKFLTKSVGSLSKLYLYRFYEVEVNIKKPNIIVNYIKYMSGVDRTDQYASTYHFLRQSLN